MHENHGSRRVTQRASSIETTLMSRSCRFRICMRETQANVLQESKVTYNVERQKVTYIRVKRNTYIGYDAIEFILANESQPRNQTAAAQPRL